MFTAERSRRIRLVLIIVFFLGAAFSASAILSYMVSRSELRNGIIEDVLPLTSDNIYSEIQRDILIPVHSSRLMAADTFLRDWYLNGEKDLGAVTRYLSEVKQRTGVYTAFFISDKTKKYYTADGLLKTVSESDPHDAWYYSARNMRNVIRIDVDTDQAHRNELTIFINYKAYDYKKNLIGITGVGLTVHEVQDLVKRYQKQYERSVYFTDSTGKIIISGDPLIPQGSMLSDISDNKKALGGLLNSSGGSLSYMRKGAVRYVNVRFIPQVKWYIFVEKNSDSAFSTIRKVLYINLTIALAVTILLAIILSAIIHLFQSRLERMAHSDFLTGLANRQGWKIIIDQAFRDAARSGKGVSVLLCDIDFFKTVNDRWGHPVGDEVLKSVAERIKKTVRNADTVFRWGGEEILVLLSRCSRKNAKELAEKIRIAIAESPVYGKGKQAVFVTVSIGIVERRKNESEELLVKRADKAMYTAKEKGRNTVIAG